MKKEIRKVVAAIIENENNEILCALRSPKMSHANMWSFPGGKVENGESISEAIEREVLEELGCVAKAGEVVDSHFHEYNKIILNLICIRCEIVTGTPVSPEHSKLIWLKRENLKSLRWIPSNLSILNILMNE